VIAQAAAGRPGSISEEAGNARETRHLELGTGN